MSATIINDDYTIISLPDDVCWYAVGCICATRVQPRCTGCTTSVPAIFIPSGTPQTPTPIGIFVFAEDVYRMYHRFGVSFSNRPWTVVIESWLDSLNNRYKWYTCHETLLTRGLQVYQLDFTSGTPFS